MLRLRPAGAGNPVNGPQPHGAHEPLHSFQAHHHPLPLHLQLSDLLVQAGDQRGVALGLPVLTVAQDTGVTLGEGLPESLNLAGVDLVSGRQLGTESSPFTASRGTLALKAGLCFLRSLDISHSSLAATAALSLGAGFPLRSRIPT